MTTNYRAALPTEECHASLNPDTIVDNKEYTGGMKWSILIFLRVCESL